MQSYVSRDFEGFAVADSGRESPCRKNFEGLVVKIVAAGTIAS
jgi:hypothetical protein